MEMLKVLRNAVALALGVGISCALAEGATRLIAPQKMSGSWYVIGENGNYLNKSQGAAVHFLPDGDSVLYEFNSMHQRGKKEPDPNAIRVLVLGDSFTFGIGLAEKDTYVALLQRELDAEFGKAKIQLMNAGVGGTGTADQLAYLEDFGDRLAPKAVVVFVSGDDLNRSVKRGLYEIAPNGKDLIGVNTSAARSRLKKLLQDSELYDYLLEHSHFVQLIRNAATSAGIGVINPATTDDGSDERHALERRLGNLLFKRMAAWCATRNIQLTVMTTGWPWGGYPWLKEDLDQEGIFFRDLRNKVVDAIGPHIDEYKLPWNNHPNKRGSILIENAAWPILRMRLKVLLLN